VIPQLPGAVEAFGARSKRTWAPRKQPVDLSGGDARFAKVEFISFPEASSRSRACRTPCWVTHPSFSRLQRVETYVQNFKSGHCPSLDVHLLPKDFATSLLINRRREDGREDTEIRNAQQCRHCQPDLYPTHDDAAVAMPSPKLSRDCTRLLARRIAGDNRHDAADQRHERKASNPATRLTVAMVLEGKTMRFMF